MRSGFLATAAAVVLAATIAGAAPNVAAFDVQTYNPPKRAPEFSLPALDGRLVGLADLRGKVALVFFWATW